MRLHLVNIGDTGWKSAFWFFPLARVSEAPAPVLTGGGAAHRSAPMSALPMTSRGARGTQKPRNPNLWTLHRNSSTGKSRVVSIRAVGRPPGHGRPDQKFPDMKNTFVPHTSDTDHIHLRHPVARDAATRSNHKCLKLFNRIFVYVLDM